MKGLYYQMRGWDEEGRPKREKLRALGIEGLYYSDGV